MTSTNKFFSELDAIPFADELSTLWPKRIAVNWFWLGFQALEKAGLTYYESDEEEMQVRIRLTLLGIFYYEFCHQSAFHESESFTYWDASFIEELKLNLPYNDDDYLFEIRKALIAYFESEEKVLAELWINCLEGSKNILSKLETKIQVYEMIISDNFNHINYMDVKDWFLSGSKGLIDYEGIAI